MKMNDPTDYGRKTNLACITYLSLLLVVLIWPGPNRVPEELLSYSKELAELLGKADTIGKNSDFAPFAYFLYSFSIFLSPFLFFAMLVELRKPTKSIYEKVYKSKSTINIFLKAVCFFLLGLAMLMFLPSGDEGGSFQAKFLRGVYTDEFKFTLFIALFNIGGLAAWTLTIQCTYAMFAKRAMVS